MNTTSRTTAPAAGAVRPSLAHSELRPTLTPYLVHPAWCDRARCTADPASRTGAGYRPVAAGRHESAPVRLDLTCAFPLPATAGEAYLTEAVAPWPCSTYLHVRVGGGEVCMPVEYVAPVLSTLNMLTATATAEAGRR